LLCREDALPRHLDEIADQHRVGFVEAEAERIIGLVTSVALVGLARPERDARGVDRQRAGDALALPLVVDGGEVADPHLVGEHRAGRQHLHAGDGHAIVAFGNDLKGRVVARLAGKDFPAADARGRRHRERNVEIVLARMFVIAGQILAKSGGEGVEQRGLHREPCDQTRNVIGRATDQTVSRIRDRLHGAHAADEVLSGATAQPR